MPGPYKLTVLITNNRGDVLQEKSWSRNRLEDFGVGVTAIQKVLDVPDVTKKGELGNLPSVWAKKGYYFLERGHQLPELDTWVDFYDREGNKEYGRVADYLGDKQKPEEVRFQTGDGASWYFKIKYE